MDIVDKDDMEIYYLDYLHSLQSLCNLLNICPESLNLKLASRLYKKNFDDLYTWYLENDMSELENLQETLSRRKASLIEKQKEFDYIVQKYEKSQHILNLICGLFKPGKDLVQLSTHEDDKHFLNTKNSLTFDYLHYDFSFVEVKEKKINELAKLISTILMTDPIDQQRFNIIKECLDGYFEKLYKEIIAERLHALDLLKNEIADKDEQYCHIVSSCEFLEHNYAINISLINKLLPNIQERNLLKQSSFSSLFFLSNNASSSGLLKTEHKELSVQNGSERHIVDLNKSR